MAHSLVARMFGTRVAETILASVHVRAHQQAGHMDASDLIKTLPNTLRGGGRPHMRPTRYRSTKRLTSCSGNGLPTRHIFTHHPKRKLHEVHNACHVGIPNGRVSVLLSPFGMLT